MLILPPTLASAAYAWNTPPPKPLAVSTLRPAPRAGPRISAPAAALVLLALLPGVAPLAYDPRKLCLRQSSSPDCESRNPCLAAGLHITGDLGVQEHTGAFDVTAEAMLGQQEQQDLGCADVYEMEYGELAPTYPANGAHVLLPGNSTLAWALLLPAAGVSNPASRRCWAGLGPCIPGCHVACTICCRGEHEAFDRAGLWGQLRSVVPPLQFGLQLYPAAHP